jgi:hypothetical protein
MTTIVATHVQPEYAAPKRYKGDWIVSAYMGRAHRVKTQEYGVARTVCGKALPRWFSADGRAWDGCRQCVASAELR